MECHLCGEVLYRHDIREHVLVRHKDQRVYQCQKCDFLTSDLREAMVEHMNIDHGVKDPLCENVHFQHLATGELLKRMIFEAPNQNESDSESLRSGDMENIHSPDSAILKDVAWSRGTSPIDSHSPQSEFTESEVPERSPDSGLVMLQSSIPESITEIGKEIINKDLSEDFSVGQVVWVWLCGYPIWPGMIAPAPAQDEHKGDHFKFNKGKQRKAAQFHCQFFGTSAERSWISARAILPWDDDLNPIDQFRHYTDILKTKFLKGRNKKMIKSEIPKSRKPSWEMAVAEAVDARSRWKDDEKRCEKLLFEYKTKTINIVQKEKRKPIKRKSILPPSIKYKLTPHSELNYRECHSTTYDANLFIPQELFDQEDKTIPADIVPGSEYYETKFSLHQSREITKEVALRALSVLKLKVSDTQLKSPRRKESEVVEERPETEWLGSRGNDVPVCVACEEDVLERESTKEMPIQCIGPCKLFYHTECDKNDPTKSESNHNESPNHDFICWSCRSQKWCCFICHGDHDDIDGDNKIIKCGDGKCGRHYHRKCLALHKFTNQHDKKLSPKCPHHTCHTCASKALTKNVNINESYQTKGKMFQCIRCPSAYHFHGERGTKSTKDDPECVPAGSILLAGRNIICPAHFQPRSGHNIHQPIHVNQCFKCFDGGELSICDSCPAAYHDYCLEKRPSSDGAWYCENCENGMRICYKDIVWIKMGQYRWWPSEVTHPTEIPPNLERMHHGPGEFVIRFLGTNEYYWVNQRRCFHYRGLMADPVSFACYNNPALYRDFDNQDKNSLNGEAKSSSSTAIRAKFRVALLEAEDKYDKLKGIKSNAGSLPFHKLSKNAYYPSFPNDLKKKIEKELEFEYEKNNTCNCYSRGDTCNEFSNCENRGLQIECGTDCKVEDCQNRKFTKRVYPPLHKFKTWWGGYGLQTKNFIPAGTFIIEYCGEIIDHDEAKRRLDESASTGVTNYYILALDKDRMIDAGPRGNYARFINHSCNPNCATEPWIVNGDKRIGIFATKDLPPEMELTFNYQLKQHGTAKTKCLCGAPNCAGFIGDKAQQKELKKDKKSRRLKQECPKGKSKPIFLLKSENDKKRRASGSVSSIPKKRKTDD